MLRQDATLRDSEGFELHQYAWLPDGPIRAVVQICHGMSEHGQRYTEFADRLTDAGFAVFCVDWRGHGLSCKDDSELGNLGPDGFESMVSHILLLREWIGQTYPNLPVFLFGHSMGSFAAHRAIERQGQAYQGAILCGTQGKLGVSLDAGIWFAKREAKQHGDTFISERLLQLMFGRYNQRYENQRTPFDWLSRDEGEVDAYIADPRCGFGLTVGSLRDMMIGLRTIHRTEELRRIPRTMPILLIAGTMDPVGNYGKGVSQLAENLRRVGVVDVTCHLYNDARHELFNEFNRAEVIQDVLNWLEARLSGSGSKRIPTDAVEQNTPK